VLIGGVKMNKRLFTKKFFAHHFLEKFYVATNNLFFEKKDSKSSLFKKKMLAPFQTFYMPAVLSQPAFLFLLNAMKPNTNKGFITFNISGCSERHPHFCTCFKN
jgi:hypothetical protein